MGCSCCVACGRHAAWTRAVGVVGQGQRCAASSGKAPAAMATGVATCHASDVTTKNVAMRDHTECVETPLGQLEVGAHQLGRKLQCKTMEMRRAH